MKVLWYNRFGSDPKLTPYQVEIHPKQTGIFLYWKEDELLIATVGHWDLNHTLLWNMLVRIDPSIPKNYLSGGGKADCGKITDWRIVEQGFCTAETNRRAIIEALSISPDYRAELRPWLNG